MRIKRSPSFDKRKLTSLLTKDSVVYASWSQSWDDSGTSFKSRSSAMRLMG